MRCFIFWISFRTVWKVVQNWIARDLLFWQISQISLAFSFFSFCTAHQLQKAKARLITRCSLWRKNGNHLGLPLLEFSTFLNTCSRVGQIKGVPKPLLKGGKRELLCSRSSEKNESSAWHEKGRVAFEVLRLRWVQRWIRGIQFHIFFIFYSGTQHKGRVGSSKKKATVEVVANLKNSIHSGLVPLLSNMTVKERTSSR